jgi:allantoinase
VDSGFDLVVRAQRLVAPDGETSGSIGIRDGRIAALEALDAPMVGTEEFLLAPGEVLLPGLVDSHVHVNEPGRTQWEGFASATHAAAAGGITTIVDMPLNSRPPTTSTAALATKKEAARGKCATDVGFWGGAIPGNVADLLPLWEAGVFGFKCFLADSGVEEFPHLTPAQLCEHLAEIARFDGLMIVHAEDADTLAGAPPAGGRRYGTYLASRPRSAETAAIGQVIEAARDTGARVHVLHLSSAEALPLLRQAKAAGVRITVETCPHYLFFDAESIPDGSTQFKCCPPIREEGNREELWRALAAGDIDLIASDHSPCTADLKRFDTGDFAQAWGGVASVQLGLSAIWTQARARGQSLRDVVRWMAEGPARLTGLTETKGRLAVGAEADLCVFAPDEEYTVDAAALYHRNHVTPYDGRTLAGVVHSTWLRGRRIDPDAPVGQFLDGRSPSLLRRPIAP